MPETECCLVLSNVVDAAEEEDVLDWLGDVQGRLQQAALPSVWYFFVTSELDVPKVKALDGTELAGQLVAVRRATAAEVAGLQGEVEVQQGHEENLEDEATIDKHSQSQLEDYSTMSADVLHTDHTGWHSKVDSAQGIPVQDRSSMDSPVRPASPLSPLSPFSPLSAGEPVNPVSPVSPASFNKPARTAEKGDEWDEESVPESDDAQLGSVTEGPNVDDSEMDSDLGKTPVGQKRKLETSPDEPINTPKYPRQEAEDRRSPPDVVATPIRRLSQLPIPRLPVTPIGRRAGLSDRAWTVKLEQLISDQRRTSEVAFAQFNSWRSIAQVELRSQQAFANEQATRAKELEKECSQLQEDLGEARASAAATRKELEARCERQSKVLVELREEITALRNNTSLEQAQLLERVNAAEAEVGKLSALNKDLNRRISDMQKPTMPTQTVELQQQIAELQKANADLLAKSSKGTDHIEMVSQLKRELQGLLGVDVQLQRAQLDLKQAQAQADKTMSLENEVQVLKDKLEGLNDILSQWRTALPGHTPESAASLVSGARTAEMEKEMVALRLQLSEAKAEQEKLTRQRDCLEVEVGRLEGLVGKGRFDASTTKVLHCSIPPLAQQRIEALEAQVKALKGGKGDDALETLQTEVEALKARLEQRDRQQQRLLNEFQKQTTQYRDNVFRLTGWKIHRTQEEGLYRLTSCFVPQEDRCLVFRPVRAKEGKAFELVDNAMAKSLSDLTGRLAGEHGIPIFLAEAQLKLRRQHS